MPDETASRTLGIAERIRRSSGRTSRCCVANTRVTAEEQKELEAAAKAKGMALSEWGREVLLREARSGAMETAMLTELIALRQLMSTVLRPVALGQTLTAEAYSEILSEVRTTKRAAAQQVLAQYQKET